MRSAHSPERSTCAEARALSSSRAASTPRPRKPAQRTALTPLPWISLGQVAILWHSTLSFHTLRRRREGGLHRLHELHESREGIVDGRRPSAHAAPPGHETVQVFYLGWFTPREVLGRRRQLVTHRHGDSFHRRDR